MYRNISKSLALGMVILLVTSVFGTIAGTGVSMNENDVEETLEVEDDEEELLGGDEFEVTIDAPSKGEEFVEGDEVLVNYTVESGGEERDTQDVEFSVDGDLEDDEEITLPKDDDYEGIWEHDEHGMPVHSVDHAEIDGTNVVFSAADNSVMAYDYEEEEKIWEYEPDIIGTIRSVHHAEIDGTNVVFSGDTDENVLAYNHDEEEKIWMHEEHFGWVYSVHHAEIDGTNVVFSGSSNNDVIAYDYEEEEVIWTHWEHDLNVNSVHHAEIDGKDVVLSGSDDGVGAPSQVVAYDYEEEEKIWQHQEHGGDVMSVTHAEIDGNDVVLSGSDDDNTVVAYDYEAEEVIWEHDEHESTVNSIDHAEIGGRDVVFSASDDYIVMAYDYHKERVLWQHQEHDDLVYSVHHSEIDGTDVVFSASRDNTVMAVEYVKGISYEGIWEHDEHGMPVHSVDYAEIDGTNVVFSAADNSVMAYDYEEEEKIWEYEPDIIGTIRSVHHAEIDGTNVVFSGDTDENVLAYNHDEEEKIWMHEEHFGWVYSVHHAEIDGTNVVFSGSSNNDVIAYDYEKEEVIWTHWEHALTVNSVYHAEIDGTDVVFSASRDNTVMAYDYQEEVVLWQHQEHEEEVMAVTHAEIDGKDVVLSGSDEDNTIIAYDYEKEEVIWEHDEHESTVNSINHAEIRGRDVVFSGSDDDTVVAYDIDREGVLWQHQEHDGRVYSVHHAEIDGTDVVFSASRDNTVMAVEYVEETSHEGEFTWVTEEGDHGYYNLKVESEDDEDEVIIIVVEPAYLEVTIDEYEDEIVEGEDQVVEYTIENTGGETVTQTIQFAVYDDHDLGGNEIYSDDKEVEIGSESTHSDQFAWPSDDSGKYSFDISSEDDSEDRNFDVGEDFVTDVTVISDPDKMDYIEGEELDLTGLIANVEWEVADTETLIWPEDNDKLETDLEDGTELTVDEHDGKTIEVWHESDDSFFPENDFTAELTVEDDYVTDVTAIENPDKMEYIEGEELDLIGLEVEVEWEVAETETLIWPEDDVVLESNPVNETELTVAEHDDETIEIWHVDREDDTIFDETDPLTVGDDYITGMEVIEDPNKMEYIQEEELDLTGLEVEVEWEIAGTETLIWPEDDDSLESDPDYGTGLTVDEHDGKTIEVWHESNDTIIDETSPLTVEDDFVTDVTVIEDPDTMEYIEGEELDLTGLEVEVEWEIAGIETLGFPGDHNVLESEPVHGIGLTVADHDEETIKVWHENNETATDETNPLVVEEDYVTDVTVISDPDKMDYVEGEEIDFTGLVVNVEWEVAGTETLIWPDDEDELGSDFEDGDELTVDDHDGETIEVWHESDDSITDFTGELTVEEQPEDPYFAVEIESPDETSEYFEGQTVEVEYNVENTGGETDTQDIEFSVDDQMIDAEVDVELDSEDTYSDTFTWTAEEPYGERDLSVDSEDDDDEVTVTVTEKIMYHTLTIDSTEGGEIVEPGEGEFEYEHGTSVDLKATPDDNYEFVEWTGDVSPIEDTEASETTIEMMDDYEITANFALEEYDLTIDSTAGGEVVVPGEGTFVYNHGTSVDVEATADDNYNFVEWTGDVSPIVDPNSAETQIEMMSHYSITAEFEEVVMEPDIQWIEELAVDGETDELEIEEGDEVEITAELENVGDETGEVTLEVNGDVIDTWDIDPADTLEIEEEYEFEDVGEYEVTLSGEYVEEQSVTVDVEEDEEDDEIPGFTSILLVVAVITAVVLYKKKRN